MPWGIFSHMFEMYGSRLAVGVGTKQGNRKRWPEWRDERLQSREETEEIYRQAAKSLKITDRGAGQGVCGALLPSPLIARGKGALLPSPLIAVLSSQPECH